MSGATGPRRVVLARVHTVASGVAAQEGLADHLCVAQPCIGMIWRAPQALIVGRSDTRLPHFATAAQCLATEGWPIAIRRSGGGACPVSDDTLQIAIARLLHPGLTIDTAYDELTAYVGALLAAYGFTAETGWRTAAYCAGRYDISVEGRKVAGLSQHWRPGGGRMTVTTALSLNVGHDPDQVASVVNRFYHLAGGPEPCRPAAIGALKMMLPAAAETNARLIDDVCRRAISVMSEDPLATLPLPCGRESVSSHNSPGLAVQSKGL